MPSPRNIRFTRLSEQGREKIAPFPPLAREIAWNCAADTMATCRSAVLGKHRRVLLNDVLALKERFDIQRKALEALAEDTGDLITNHSL